MKTRESRLDLRANAHNKQCFYYQMLIKKLKPDWFESKDGHLAYADTEECPLVHIWEIFDQADKAWNRGEDYDAAISQMSDKCHKVIKDFK